MILKIYQEFWQTWFWFDWLTSHTFLKIHFPFIHDIHLLYFFVHISLICSALKILMKLKSLITLRGDKVWKEGGWIYLTGEGCWTSGGGWKLRWLQWPERAFIWSLLWCTAQYSFYKFTAEQISRSISIVNLVSLGIAAGRVLLAIVLRIMEKFQDHLLNLAHPWKRKMLKFKKNYWVVLTVSFPSDNHRLNLAHSYPVLN